MNCKCLPDNVEVKHSLPYRKLESVPRIKPNYSWHQYIGINRSFFTKESTLEAFLVVKVLKNRH